MPQHFHPICESDRAVMAATRAVLQSMPDLQISPQARPFFDEMIAQTPLADGVGYEHSSLGGRPGWWCRAPKSTRHAAILYLHGGGYVIGSAAAYRHPVGHFAAEAGVDAFALEYALAPEHPFPAALTDALAAYDDLVGQGFQKMVIAGDSAGGGLALALTEMVCRTRTTRPAGVVAISPWTDLTMSGESFVSRVQFDPMLTREKLVATARLYLDQADPTDPRASPLFGDVAGLPPILIHVGQDEVLLDDAVRYARKVEVAGGACVLHVWEGMLHVFTSSIATLEAARAAMSDIGSFIQSQTCNCPTS